MITKLSEDNLPDRGRGRGRGVLLSIMAVLLAGGLAWVFNMSGGSVQNVALASVESGEFIVRSVYNGKLESRNVVTILSQFQGVATVVRIAPEGSRVEPGTVLVEFDASKLERDLVKLEREYALARADLEGLIKAKIPLELRELELSLIESRGSLEAEQQYLEDSLTLQRQSLISPQEVKQQQRKVKALQSKVDKLALEFQLTREFLHPSTVKRAQTKASSSEQALKLARQQIRASTITAPAPGVVVYKPLNISGEFRTVRVGDNVYPNQPFMVLPDMQDLVVHCSIPESELSQVKPGGETLVRPLAYPSLTLPGTVESIGAVAQTLPGQPAWQKFFHVVIDIDKVDPLVRPGMSVTAHVLSFYKQTATLIPRRAVSWDKGRALAKIVHGGATTIRELSLGLANDTFYEVLDGVESGDQVVIQ